MYFGIVSLGDLRQKVPEFLAYYILLSILYLLACALGSKSGGQNELWVVLGFAVAFRLVMLFSPPSLSDDVYRYAWEGYLQTRGVNPYSHPPAAPELSPHRNELWEKVNNKDASAIYPPVVQMVHAGTFLLFRSIWGYKILFVALECLFLVVLLRLLNHTSRDPLSIIFYAWNPLVVVEIAGSGHHDGLASAFLFISVLFCLTQRFQRSVLWFGSSALCKLYPALGLPFFLQRIPRKHWFWLPVLLLASYLPYAGAGNRLFSALLYYREKWRFNGYLYYVLSEVLSDEKTVERLLLLFLLLVIAGCLLRVRTLLEQLFWITGAVLVSAPTLFPWYLIWIAPFLCFFPNPAWLLLTSLIGLSYYVLIDWWTLGVWQQSLLFLRLQYFPFYGLLISSFLWNRLRNRQATGP